MNSFIKNHIGLIVSAIILILFSILSKDMSFIWILFYVLFINLLLSKYIKRNAKKGLVIVIWTSFIVIFSLEFYVNYYLPHGPSYPTGEYVCQNDGRGACSEQYIEDTSKLNIPDWAKFLRSSGGMLLIAGLFFAGIVISNKNKNE
jgi:hypothetical protein